jgi:hypothetical protein
MEVSALRAIPLTLTFGEPPELSAMVNHYIYPDNSVLIILEFGKVIAYLLQKTKGRQRFAETLHESG